MRNKNTFLSVIILLLLSFALCFAAYYASIMATQYDLGQLAYLFLIFSPIAAVIIGVLANTLAGRWWLAPAISLGAFAAFMMIRYNAINIRYVLAYMLISLVGYFITYAIRKITKR
jgi:hypothetical protein